MVELVECYNNTINININYQISGHFPHHFNGGEMVEFHQNGRCVPLLRMWLSQSVTFCPTLTSKMGWHDMCYTHNVECCIIFYGAL